MPALALRQDQSLSPSPAHQWFTDHLPELNSRAHALFHRLRYEERQDAVAEVLAFIFQYALRAGQRGVLDRLTPYTMVVFCGKNYRSGRRFAGSSSLCPLSKQTQIERGTTVVSIEESRTEYSSEASQYIAVRIAEMLPDGHNHDQPLQNVRREVDYPDILNREEISTKARRVFDFLLETNSDGQLIDLCPELKVTPGRITQLKGELADALAGHDYTPGRARTCNLAKRKRRGRRPGYRRAGYIPLNARPEPVSA